MQTRTTAASILKELYLGKVVDQLNDEVGPCYAQVTRSTENVEGLETVRDIHTGRNASAVSRAEYGDLPTAGLQTYAKIRSSLKSHYGAIQFTGQLIRTAATDRASFVNAAENETDRIIGDLQQQQARQLWNDAEESLMDIPTGSSISGQVLTVSGGAGDVKLFQHLVVGQIVDIGTTGVQADQADSVTISAIDITAGTITFTGTVSSVTDAGFIRVEDSFGNENTGLQAIVAAGDTLHGLSGATTGVWNATVKSNGGTLRAPTHLLVMSMIDDIAITVGGNMTPNLVVGGHAESRAVEAQFDTNRRYVNEVTLKGGYKGISVATPSGEVNILADRFVPSDKLFFLNTDYLTLDQAADWEWMQEDGAVLNRVSGKDAYSAVAFKYCELTTNRRNAHGVINDVQGLSA